MNMPESIESWGISTFSPAQIHSARAVATQTQRRIVDILEEQSELGADSFVLSLGYTLHYPTFDKDALYQLTPSFEFISFAEAAKRECLILMEDGQIIVVICDPFDLSLQTWIEYQLRKHDFIFGLAHRSDVAEYLGRHEETLHAMDNIVSVGSGAVIPEIVVDNLSIKSISEDVSPVIRLVNSTVYDALRISASDIHLVTTPFGLQIKYRIDGVLTQVGVIAGMDIAEQVVSRVKIMSSLDIAEQRVPQDGRFKVSLQGREVDFRVSIMPSIFGEDVVLRILDKQTLTDHLNSLRLCNLGFDETDITGLLRLANEPYGMLLVTGPTGSGKTTTLYGVISEINNGQDKIITIEDPVEYQLPGVLQIPVNEKKGLTFARGLRSILRHDPDKIMVGEIRDEETAQIAIQSALTGHQVFTTVHANNTIDVIGRFINMGVDPYSFVSALNGIVAQRLIRLNCSHCSAEVYPDVKLVVNSGISKEDASSINFRAGCGCGECHGTGFKGRKSIAEILYMNDTIRELITARQPARVIREVACNNGTHFLRESAIDMVRRGETTLQEINRVTFV